jgi:hypothetical protein
MMTRALGLAAIWLVACGPAEEPKTPVQSPTPEPGASAVTSAPAETTGEPAPSEAPSPPAEPVAPAETKAATPSIRAVCLEMCDKVKAKCAKSAFEACQVNCGKYESPAEGCASVVVAALTCARDAADLVCANVAPESCAKPFRRIAACNSGQKTEEAAPAASSLPAGFAVYQNSQEGLSVPMPEGVTAGEGNVLATAKHTDGTVYSIRKLPRPEGKLNEKLFLKLAMNLFGRCSDKMKMGGMVDKPGRTSINYTTKCPDGTEEAGLFWATSKVLYLATAKAPLGKLGPTEAFVYGFEVK